MTLPPSVVHSLSIQSYSFAIHSPFSLHALSIHSLCTLHSGIPSLFTLHSLCLQSPVTLYSFSILTLHSLPMHSLLTLHSVFIRSVDIMHQSPCTLLHSLSIRSLLALDSLAIRSLFDRYSLFALSSLLALYSLSIRSSIRSLFALLAVFRLPTHRFFWLHCPPPSPPCPFSFIAVPFSSFSVSFRCTIPLFSTSYPFSVLPVRLRLLLPHLLRPSPSSLSVSPLPSSSPSSPSSSSSYFLLSFSGW
jgi:hypothetical protein